MIDQVEGTLFDETEQVAAIEIIYRGKILESTASLQKDSTVYILTRFLNQQFSNNNDESGGTNYCSCCLKALNDQTLVWCSNCAKSHCSGCYVKCNYGKIA